MGRRPLKSILVPAIILAVVGVGGWWAFFGRDPHVRAGRHLYLKYCSPCHGPKGTGEGYNAENLDPHPQDLTDSEDSYMAELTNGQIVEAIRDGGRGIETTPLMPAFGLVLSELEIASLTAYIRTLHPYEGEPVSFPPTLNPARPRSPRVREEEFTALYEAEVPNQEAYAQLVEEGQVLAIEEYACDGCHTIGEYGGTLGPSLSRAGFMLQPQFIYRWIRNPQGFKPDTRMPNLGLSEHEALAVALYLSTLTGGPPAEGS